MSGPRTQAEVSVGRREAHVPRRAACAPAAQPRAREQTTDRVLALQRSAGNAAVARAAEQRGDRSAIPAALKHGAERLSGLSLDDVRVHRESARPAAVGALAYTRGSEIHLGPGQDRHLAHEVWHVVQQKQARVKANMQLAGHPANADRALEDEADSMGRAALTARDEPQGELAQRPSSPDGPVLQPRLGFELELLVLVDINGRPIPEKTRLGTYGPHNLILTVDHGPAVDSPTPVPAALGSTAIPTAGGGGPLLLGPYDTPVGTRTQMAHPPGGPLPVDPRIAGAPIVHLAPGGWAALTHGIAMGRNRRPDNRPLQAIAGQIARYLHLYDNWEVAEAQVVLAGISAAIGAWRAVNPAAAGAHTPASWYRRRARWRAGDAALTALTAEIAQHNVFWAANPAPPVGMARQYAAAGAGAWQAAHPLFTPAEGMGGDRYASILEIVTPGGAGSEPETALGRARILAEVASAVTLANAIVGAGATNNLTQRVLLNTIAGTALNEPRTYIGHPAQPAQTVDASIQSTFGVDLAQLASLATSIAGLGGQAQFELKHHADTFGPGPLFHPIARARAELARCAADATAILNAVGRPGPGGPSLVNLRGLLVLVCQYLRMGRYMHHNGAWGLDKNLVDLLSRVDLATIFADGVPGPVGTAGTEKHWVAANLPALVTQTLLRTGRNGASRLLTDTAEATAAPPGSPAGFLVTSQQFVQNVFTAASDGVTPHFGGWAAPWAMEDVDPAGTRNLTDTRAPGAAHRTGPVFELRNMTTLAGGRFPPAAWVPLATYFVDLLAALNARTEAQAVSDSRFAAASAAHPQGHLLHNAPW